MLGLHPHEYMGYLSACQSVLPFFGDEFERINRYKLLFYGSLIFEDRTRQKTVSLESLNKVSDFGSYLGIPEGYLKITLAFRGDFVLVTISTISDEHITQGIASNPDDAVIKAIHNWTGE